MELVYTTEEAPSAYAKSIFLAGPSPRKQGDHNWRDEALAILKELDFDGVVYIPLPRDGKWPTSYESVAGWERKNLDRADCILFWVPRTLPDMLGLTTNIEFGTWYTSGRTVLGYPQDAAHVRYLGLCAKEEGIPLAFTLRETIVNAIKLVGGGYTRKDGERDIPLCIWKKPEFQGWYQNQVAAGNRLDGAKVVWTFRVGPLKTYLFFYAVHVDVFIAAENRHKTNEIVLFRSDISVIVGYWKPSRDSVGNTEIAMIREFRSPVNNSDGMVHELPGGSSFKPGENHLEVAAHEFAEETGLHLEASRFRKMRSRQIAATLSAHKAHLYTVALTPDEMSWLKTQAASGAHQGVEEDTERTYVEIQNLDDILESDNVDWSMLGMALQAIL